MFRIPISLCSICFFLCIAQTSLSQDVARWQWINPRPTPNNLTDLHMLDGQTGWAVGYFGTILKTEDGGQTWIPQFSDFTNHLNGVHFLDGENGWIAGNDGIILKTTDGGTNWKASVSAPPLLSYSDIQFVSPQIGMAVSSQGKIVRTVNGGNTWTEVPLSQTNSLTKLQFVSPTIGWAIGAGGRILKTTNSGETWFIQSANNVGTYYDICMLDENEGWLTSLSTTLYKTTNGGQNWNSVVVGNASFGIVAVDFHTSQKGIIGLGNNTTLTTSDGGITWQQKSSLAGYPGRICFLGENEILYVGYNGKTGRSSNFAQSWADLPAQINHQFSGLEIVGESTLYTSTYSKIMKSTDGGYNWQSVSIPLSASMSKIRFTTPRVGYALGLDKLIKTTNGGTSWNLVNLPPGFSAYDFHFINPDVGWAVGNNSIVCRTFNGGLDWQFANYSPTENFLSVQFLSNTTGYCASSGGKIFKSVDGGLTWNQIAQSGTTKVKFFDSQFGFGFIPQANSWNAGICRRTTNGGISWINAGTLSGLRDLDFVNPMNGWAINENALISYTTNAGVSWKSFTIAASGGLTALRMVNSKLGYAVGNGGRILRFSLVPGLARKQNLVRGTIFRNRNNDCDLQDDEAGIKENVVIATPGPVFSLSNGNGQYQIPLDEGTYQVSQIIPGQNLVLQNQYCPVNNGSFSFTFPSNKDTLLNQNFANNLTECPLMNVSVGSTRRRRCFRNTTTITYSNTGHSASDPQSTIYLKLPAHVNLIHSSRPYTFNANLGAYQFEIGSTPAGSSGSIITTDSVSCIPGITGTEQCTKVWITPGNSCVPSPPGWDGVDLKVTAKCIGQTPTFTIKNVGSEMTNPRPFRVFVDSLFAYSSEFLLISNDSITVQVPITPQRAAWLEVKQSPYHPFSTFASASTFCGAIPRFSTFAPNDEDPVEDVDCMLIIDSFDPNDKTPTPKGNTADGNIEPNTQIEYKIRFQNTGTDTAYTVVISDTLPATLDIRSLELGAYSHPYQFNVSGKGRPVLTFRFPNIYLPDSNVNEPASNGFVCFRIRPFASLPLGTRIRNAADIYFDYNEPVRTNLTQNTLFVPVITPGLVSNVTVITQVGSRVEKSGIVFYPNPASGSFTIRSGYNGKYRIVGLVGEEVGSGSVEAGTREVDVKHLKPGVYFLDLETVHGREVRKLVLE